MSKKTISHYPISAVDFVPTVLDLAGIENNHDFDGKTFKTVLFNSEKVLYDKHVLVEYWGEGNAKTIDPECVFVNDNNLAVKYYLFFLIIITTVNFFRNVQKMHGVNVKIPRTILILVF